VATLRSQPTKSAAIWGMSAKRIFMKQAAIYPDVLSEVDTVKRILDGASIARFGDGEFKLVRGADCVSQFFDRNLQAELKAILRDPDPRCLVGIPNINGATPKADFWAGYRYTAALLKPGHQWASSFIARPDSAPWIDTWEYWVETIA
jgi:Glycosyltransferase GT-D fold